MCTVPVYDEMKCYEVWYLEYLLECKYKYGLTLNSLNSKCKSTEQVNCFNRLESSIFYEKQVDIDNTMNKCMKITGNINNMIRPQKTLKKTIIKLYKLGLPALLYGSTNWTI